MFDIKIIASGSRGNAYIIQDGQKRIIIDPGLSINELVHKSGFLISKLDFCLVSHEHKDHSKSADAVSRFGVPLIMSDGTSKALNDLYCIKAVSEKPIIDFEGWDILPFEIQHDAAEPLGFLIRTPSEKKICYASDTYYIQYQFPGVTHWMVEANYSEKIMGANDDLHPIHKDRVRQSHFEIENLKAFFAAQDLSVTELIYLLHLSDDNSEEDNFVTEIARVTGKPVYLS